MERPAGFDLEQYRASQAEIQKASFPVRLGSEKVTVDGDGNECEPYEKDDIIDIPHPDYWSFEAQVKMAQGDLYGWIADLVGQTNLERFWAAGFTMGEFRALQDAIGRWSGFSQGPGSPLPPPSGSTRVSN